MNLIASDDLPYHVSRMTRGEVLASTSVQSFESVANGFGETVELRSMLERINIGRANEGKDYLSDSLFSLLDLDCERHGRTKAEATKLLKLQAKICKRLGVPHGESSLPWMIYATYNVGD